MKKMNKKGFTLVELLAVIAILAILMLLVTPSVLKLFTEGKQNAFVTQVQSVWKAAENQYIKDAIGSSTPGPYCYAGKTLTDKTSGSGKFATVSNENKLDISDNSSLAYYVNFDATGKITNLIVTDGTYYYSKSSDLSIDVASSDVHEVGAKDTFTCGTYTHAE